MLNVILIILGAYFFINFIIAIACLSVEMSGKGFLVLCLMAVPLLTIGIIAEESKIFKWWLRV